MVAPMAAPATGPMTGIGMAMAAPTTAPVVTSFPRSDRAASFPILAASFPRATACFFAHSEAMRASSSSTLPSPLRSPKRMADLVTTSLAALPTCFSGSTVAGRKSMISLETGSKAQTTKQAWQGLKGSARSTPRLRTGTSGAGSCQSGR